MLAGRSKPSTVASSSAVTAPTYSFTANTSDVHATTSNPKVSGRCSSNGFNISTDRTGSSLRPASAVSSTTKQYLKYQETTIASSGIPVHPDLKASNSSTVKVATSTRGVL